MSDFDKIMHQQYNQATKFQYILSTPALAIMGLVRSPPKHSNHADVTVNVYVCANIEHS